MIRRWLLFLFLTVPAFGQHNIINPYRYATPAGCTVTTNAITINLLTSFADTSNNTFYASASVTPSAAGATLIAVVATSPVVNDHVVTNTGTTQLSWHLAGITQTNGYAATNFNTLGTPTARLSIWVSQLPPGVTPFAMRVVPALITSGSGCNLHVYEALGVDTNLLWGVNAIAQVTHRGSNAVANPRIDWNTPTSASNAWIVAVADDVNSAADNAPETGWTEGAETAYNTPATGLATYYRLAVPTATTFTTNDATSRDWGALAIELRAGTNSCGDTLDPFTIPAGASQFYVNTDLTPGGDGTDSNELAGATRAFATLNDAITHANLDTSSNTVRVIWCKGVLADVENVVQAEWNSITTTPTTYLMVIGDNTTGVYSTSHYRIEVTNANAWYNNQPGHVRVKNVQIKVRGTTSSGTATYSGMRLSTANVGVGRTDCLCIGENIIVQVQQTGGDDVIGFASSQFAVAGDVRNKMKWINCIAYATENTGSFCYGFNSAPSLPWVPEYYNCTAYTNDLNWDGAAIVVNCLAVGGSVADFSGVTAVLGHTFSRQNASSSTGASGHQSRHNQVFTFVSESTGDFDLQSGDAGAKGFALDDPLSGVFRFDIEGNTRATPWDIGAHKAN